MPSDEPPLHVTRLDRGRYLVRSESRARIHFLVDLGDPDFASGRCDCEDWNIRIECPMRHGEEPPRPDCKHIRRVRSQLEHAATLCVAAGYDASYAERLIPPA